MKSPFFLPFLFAAPCFLGSPLLAQAQTPGWGHVTNAMSFPVTVLVKSPRNTRGARFTLGPGGQLNLLRSPRYTIQVDGRSFQVAIADPAQFDHTKPAPVWVRQYYFLSRSNNRILLNTGVPPPWRSAIRRRYSQLRGARSLPNVFSDRAAPKQHLEKLILRSATIALRKALLDVLPATPSDTASITWRNNKLSVAGFVPLTATIKELRPETIEFLRSAISHATGVARSHIDVSTWDGVVRRVVSGEFSILSGVQIRPQFYTNDKINLSIVEAAMSPVLAGLPVALDSVVAARTARRRQYESDWKFLNRASIPPMLRGQHVQWRLQITVATPQDSPATLKVHCILRVRHKYRGQPISRFVELDRATTLSVSGSKNGFVNWRETPPDATFERIQKDVVAAIRKTITQRSTQPAPPIP